MFEGEEELVVFSDEVGVAIAESVKVAGATEGLPELCAVLFAHVMDEDDGHFELSLELSEEAEECGDFGAGVFIGAMQSDEGVEEEELRFELFDGIDEPCSVGFEVEPEGGCVDDVEVEGLDVEAAMIADAEYPFFDHGGGVLGEVDKSGSLVVDLEMVEARGIRSDTDGDVQAEP